MKDNHLIVDPTGMPPKLYDADCSIFVWVAIPIKESSYFKGGIQSREWATRGYRNKVSSAFLLDQ